MDSGFVEFMLSQLGQARRGLTVHGPVGTGVRCALVLSDSTKEMFRVKGTVLGARIAFHLTLHTPIPCPGAHNLKCDIVYIHAC